MIAIYLLINEEECLVFNNCEHFARSSATGEKRSGQVEKVVTGVAKTHSC